MCVDGVVEQEGVSLNRECMFKFIYVYTQRGTMLVYIYMYVYEYVARTCVLYLFEYTM